jgi:hypothetical protein
MVKEGLRVSLISQLQTPVRLVCLVPLISRPVQRDLMRKLLVAQLGRVG